MCAYLNSSVGLVWFRNRGKLKGDMIFLQGDSLGVFPIPIASNEETLELEFLLSKIQGVVAASDDFYEVYETDDYRELYSQLDDLVFRHYKLTESEIETLKIEAKALLQG
jgi:hypothetical protein